jgi:hypothetical protein
MRRPPHEHHPTNCHRERVGCLIYVMVAVETEDTAQAKQQDPLAKEDNATSSLPVAANGDGAATASSPGF